MLSRYAHLGFEFEDCTGLGGKVMTAECLRIITQAETLPVGLSVLTSLNPSKACDGGMSTLELGGLPTQVCGLSPRSKRPDATSANETALIVGHR